MRLAPQGHGSALALLIGTLVAFFAPVLFRGYVVYSHDNASQAGVLSPAELEARPFSDQSDAFLPEIHSHLNGDRSGWLATWNPSNEMGRPLWQHYAAGRSFLIGNFVSWFTRDAFRFYSSMAVLAATCTALFAYLYLRQLELSPMACLTGAVPIAVGPFVLMWQSIVTLQWGYAWSFALLFAIERNLRRPSVWSFFGIGFAVHALLLSSYPQLIALHAWVLGGYVLVRVLSIRRGAAARLRALAWLGGAVLLGALAAAPVYFDLFVEMQRSARVTVGERPALAALPQIETLEQLRCLWLHLYDAFWLGNPVALDYPVRPVSFAGFSLSAPYLALVSVSVLSWRVGRTWYWLAVAALALLATFSSGAFLFGVRYLGLGLSALAPVAGALLAFSVLAATAADRLLRGDASGRGRRAVAAAIPLVLTLTLVLSGQLELDAKGYALGLGLGAGAILFAAFPRSSLLALLVLGVVFLEGRATLLVRPRDQIVTDSPLAAELRARTADGSRLLWIHNRPPGLLPSNQEMLLGLRSVHGYYSLQSAAYVAWAGPLRGEREQVEGVSAEFAGYDRRFQRVARPDLLALQAIAGAGVSTLVSLRPLPADMGAVVARIGEVEIVDAAGQGPRFAHFRQGAFRQTGPGEVRVPPLQLLDADNAVPGTELHDDLVAARLRPRHGQSLLFVSQQFHPHWVARAGGEELETVRVNSLYQGVLVPAGVSAVLLRFEPFSRWSWIPQVGFALVGVLALLARLRRGCLG